MSATHEVIVGAHTWFEGSLWVVQEIVGGGVVISQGTVMRRVGFAMLAASNSDVTSDDDLQSVPQALGGLPPAQRKKLKAVEHELLVIVDPEGEDGLTESERVSQAAANLGISVRSVWRKVAAYRSSGLAGLIDSSPQRKYESTVDPRWDKACLHVLAELTYESTPTKKAVLSRTTKALDAEYGPGNIEIPSSATAYRRLDELAKGRQAFGQGKARRSIAERPQGMYGRLRAQYPGEYVLLDSTPLDVFVLEEGTGRWVSVELTVAIDLFSRCIVGLRLAPISTDARDIADVLYQVVAPPEEDSEGFPYHGVPHNLVIGTGDDHAPLGAVPGTIVVDHGKAYLSDHVRGACLRIGINIQPATPHKPTDYPEDSVIPSLGCRPFVWPVL